MIVLVLSGQRYEDYPSEGLFVAIVGPIDPGVLCAPGFAPPFGFMESLSHPIPAQAPDFQKLPIFQKIRINEKLIVCSCTSDDFW